MPASLRTGPTGSQADPPPGSDATAKRKRLRARTPARHHAAGACGRHLSGALLTKPRRKIKLPPPSSGFRGRHFPLSGLGYEVATPLAPAGRKEGPGSRAPGGDVGKARGPASGAPRRRGPGARGFGSSVPSPIPLVAREHSATRHFGVAGCGQAPTGKGRMRFRWLRDSHAQPRPPSVWGVAAERVWNGPRVLPIPGLAPDAKKRVLVTASRARGRPSYATKASRLLGTMQPADARRRDLGPPTCGVASRLLLRRVLAVGVPFYREVRLVRATNPENHP